MPYGQGKMIGDTVDPRLFVQDYSGMADVARMQAQGYAALGQGIGTAIEKLGDYKKQQAEQEKAVKRADTIASLIEKQLPEFAGEVAPIRAQLGDKNIPLKDRFAAAESINDILNIGTQIKKLQLDEAQVMAGARSQQRPIAEWEIINVPAKDGSTVMAERNKFTGEIRRPDFSGLSGGGMPQYMGGGTTDINDPSAWSQDPTLDALDPSMIDIPGQPVASPQEFQGVPTSFMLPQERMAQQISSAANMPVNPPAGTTGPFDASGNYIESAADMKVRPQAAPQQVAQAPVQAGAELGRTPPKISTTKPPRAVYTNEQFNKAREEGASINAIQRQDGKWDVYNINYGQPEGGIVNEYDENGRLIKTTIGGKGGKAPSEQIEQAKRISATESSRIALNATEQALNNFDKVVAKTPTGAWIAKGESLLLPAGEKGAFANNLTAINNENSFLRMKGLRDSSKTGGAAGTMTEKEWPRFESRFGKLDINQKDNQLLRNLQLNALNTYETINGMPDDVINALEKGKITQEDFNDYVDGYSQVRRIAKVDAAGVPGEATRWTKFDTRLLDKYTGAGQIKGQAQPQDEVDAIEAKRKALREQYGF